MALRSIIYGGLLRLSVPKSNRLHYSSKCSAKNLMRHSDELTINKLLANNENFESKQWAAARDEILTSFKYINESNIDGIIINRCCLVNKYQAALNYIEYLMNEKKKDLNLVSILKYFKILYDNYDTLDANHTTQVLQLYDEIRKKYNVLDQVTLEGCILGLSLTNRWKESLDLVEENKSHCTSRSVSCRAIIIAALNNDEQEVAWSFLKQLPPYTVLCRKIAVAYTNFCQRNFQHFDTLKIAMDKLFDFCEQYTINFSAVSINVLSNFFKDTGYWDYASTTIDKNGICEKCDHSLSHFEINDEHRKILLKYILNNVIVGNDVFRKTTPTELNKFLQFIDRTRPYDVVVDGLNVAYGFYKNSKRAQNIRIAIDTLSERHKKILVLGKRHMLKWSLEDMKEVEKKSFLFLTNNTSEDDLFTIYAALASGSHTYFLTQDFLRDHSFFLTNDMVKVIFRKWQLTRQLKPSYTKTASSKYIEIDYPPPYAVVPHKDEKGWHIPYLSSIEPNKHPDRWMCLRITKKVENTASS